MYGYQMITRNIELRYIFINVYILEDLVLIQICIYLNQSGDMLFFKEIHTQIINNFIE